MLVFGGVLLTAAAVLFGVLARDAIAFYKSPTELASGEYGAGQFLRVGGLVVEGSSRQNGALRVFEITDTGATVTVEFAGLLPDLFREGQGIVAEGYWQQDRFVAIEVLARHDENYMPKEVADALRAQGHYHGDD